MKNERKVIVLPKTLFIVLTLAVLIQFYATWQLTSSSKKQFKQLDSPKSYETYQLLSLGAEFLTAHILTLQLQLHDNQQGRHIDYKNLSYPKLSEWLLQLQQMNLSSEYSALLAARVFSNTSNKEQLRIALDTVVKLFKNNPKLNWRWMAEGAVIAKYHLKDLDLALSMAQEIARLPKDVDIPAWSRDLEFIMLEEMNLIESAIFVVENSLKDKNNMHPDEQRFLEHRLSVLKQKLSKI